MIELKNLEKTYGNGSVVTHVLHDISFRIDPNEYVAVMGASGTGKSTLMNILGCLDKPTGGSYHLDRRSGLEVLSIFKRLHGEGRTILLVTHSEEVAEHADRVIVLHDGTVAEDRRVAQPRDAEFEKAEQ